MPKILLNALLSHQKIAVFSHIKPDGDCLGAQFGLALWLQAQGKEVIAFNRDEVPDYLHFLADYAQFPLNNTQSLDHDLADVEAILIVDGNKPDRFGEEFERIAKETHLPIYCLDHHPDPANIFATQYTNSDMSSSCEMVYHVISAKESGFDYLSTAAAKCLYTGIITDTGSHAYDSVTPTTLRASAHLLELGNFKPNEIQEKLYASKNLNEIKLLGLALTTLKLHFNDQIATIETPYTFFAQSGATPDQTEGIVHYALSIEGVKAAVFFKELANEGVVKMSLRSKSELDVNEWGKQINGGGHAKAAGAKLSGTLQEVKTRVLAVGKTLLDKHVL